MVSLLRNIMIILCGTLLCVFSVSAEFWSEPPKPTIEVKLDDYFVTNALSVERKYVKFALAFQVQDAATSEAIMQNQLLLNNAILLSISAASYDELITETGKITFQNRLQQELMTVLKQQQLPYAISSLSFSEFALD